MVTRSFLKAHADALSTLREMLEDESQCPPQLERLIEVAQADEEMLARRKRGEEEDEEDYESGNVQYVHVTSRIHLGRYLLEKDRVKQILVEECLHYARVCEIEILHYCVMDNHFHLLVGLRYYSDSLSKMMGCIKQQFTNKFKAWFNNEYRKENRYRKKALTNGTLWQGRCHYELIENEAQFAACCLYIENNRVVVESKYDIGMLEDPPCFQSPCSTGHQGGDGAQGDGRLQKCYEELLDKVRGYRFQSAAYYLGACPAHQTCLTNGRDAVWASDAEVEEYFKLAANKLPEGWRKCWFKDNVGIVKSTEDSRRQFPDNPFYERLGTSEEARAAHYGRYMMGACYRKRAIICNIEDDDRSYLAGVTLD